MKLFVLAVAAGLALAAQPAGAVDAKQPLQLKPKSALVTTAPHQSAPFINPGAEPELDLLPRRDLRHDQSRSSCEGARSLCYDQHSGKIVYKPARQYMPDIPGLTRENISVKRDRITFRYSF